jgi:hypothetical protein
LFQFPGVDLLVSLVLFVLLSVLPISSSSQYFQSLPNDACHLVSDDVTSNISFPRTACVKTTTSTDNSTQKLPVHARRHQYSDRFRVVVAFLVATYARVWRPMGEGSSVRTSPYTLQLRIVQRDDDHISSSGWWETDVFGHVLMHFTHMSQVRQDLVHMRFIEKLMRLVRNRQK